MNSPRRKKKSPNQEPVSNHLLLKRSRFVSKSASEERTWQICYYVEDVRVFYAPYAAPREKRGLQSTRSHSGAFAQRLSCIYPR